MPRRKRPATTTRSEHWLRVLVNASPDLIGQRLNTAFGIAVDSIVWLSPLKHDDFAEYYDQAFIDRLGLGQLRMPLADFWPASGPRWDGLARTGDGKVILVEAKAYVEECVDYRSRAEEDSLKRINQRLDEAKKAFKASGDAYWQQPLYQYANRLAHLYYLAQINGIDAYLAFVCFANAPDVADPTTPEAWHGANRLVHKCLGLNRGALVKRVADIVIDVNELAGTV